MNETFLGQVELFPYTFIPQGWMSCEGQLLQIQAYAALFSLIGNTYGGDGMSTFAVPNLKGKAPDAHMNYCIALQGSFPPRA